MRVAAIAFLLLAGQAQAQETTIVAERALACIDAADLDRVQQLVRSGDKDAAAVLITQREITGRCLWLKRGDRVFIERYGYEHVRLHRAGDPTQLHILGEGARQR